jgi:predicted porin
VYLKRKSTMNKLLATLLVSLGVSSVYAQSSVSVYGLIDASMQSHKVDNAGSNTAMVDNTLAASRLGFKGSEDLGGGLKAEFQLESGLTPSTGKAGKASEQLFSRESWVGLTDAKLGSVRIGLTDVTSSANIDARVSQMGDMALVSELTTDRAKTVRYISPKIAGFTAEVGYSNPDSTTTSEITAGRTTAAFLGYEAGKLGVYGGVEQRAIDGHYTQKQSMVGARYDFGVARLGAYYSVRDGETANTADSAELEQTRISVAVPVTASVTAHAAYLKNETATQASTDYTGYKVALTKAFSKRTTAYAGYVTTDAVGSTADSQTYIAGVVHSF